MDQYRVLKFPLTTESARKKTEDKATLVFVVDLRSNKNQFKSALEKMHNAKVSALIAR